MPRKAKKRKGKKKRDWMNCPCASARRHFCQLRCSKSPPNFLPILGRKYFGKPWEKTHGPTNFFPSPPTNQTPTKNVFSLFFPSSLKSTQPNISYISSIIFPFLILPLLHFFNQTDP